MSDRPLFLMITCQVGAAAAVKAEVAKRWPDFRFAYSRPGFLTFRLPEGHKLRSDFDPDLVFARAYGLSLGKVNAESIDELAAAAWQLWGERPVRRIHVWPRDTSDAGFKSFEPGITPEALAAHAAMLRACPCPDALAPGADDPLHAAKLGESVLDCVLMEPNEWWIGLHRAHEGPSQWPGGMISLTLPAEAVSRAWLKMEEALRWAGFPISAGARVAEIGSAPGGASQALLARGLLVTGVDPAAMDPRVLEHPHFTHIRRRSAQVRRREFRKIRWLTADMNVAPNYTLDAIEAIVTHSEVSIRGMILTLKLIEWDLASQLPEYLERIAGWGYNIVRARQLQHNRKEVCVAALQKPFLRKS